tara:strand:+ start:156 stop:797 length:642 start_codon:yes stop_codon:yes gene_type:complete
MIIKKDNFELIIKKIFSKKFNRKKRIIIGIAGPCCSGKSTFSSELNTYLLRNYKNQNSKVVMMDGFHFDNSILRQRKLISKKGEPITFDSEAFLDLVKKIKKKHNSHITFPIFDRKLDLSRSSADSMNKSNRVIIIEGNYLLLKKSPWKKLKQYIDFFVFLKVDKNILKDRIQKRWKYYGLSKNAIQKKVKNDMNLVNITSKKSAKADIIINN